MSETEPTPRPRPSESGKITDAHRAKLAVVYVRQSTPQQVAENRERPSEELAADEWWFRDLADELGVGCGRFKEWVKRGYVHARRVGSRKHLAIWAMPRSGSGSAGSGRFVPARRAPIPLSSLAPARPDQGS